MNVKIALYPPRAAERVILDHTPSGVEGVTIDGVRYVEAVVDGAVYRISDATGSQYVRRRSGLIVAEKEGRGLSVAPEVGNVVQVHIP